jgi:integrase/recombinase XerD
MQAEDINQRPGAIAVVTARNIQLRLPKNAGDIEFIRSLGHSRWDAAGFCWVIPNYSVNIEKMKQYFKERLIFHDMADKGKKDQAVNMQVEPQSLLVVRFHNGRIRLIFKYDRAMMDYIKQFPLYSWDPETLSWTLPHTEKILSKLSYYCSIHGWEYRYVEDISFLKRKPKPKQDEITGYRKCPEIYLERMTVLRYSPRTIQVYADCFTEFINYYPEKPIEDITQAEIMTYLKYLIEDRCVSTSYQNQAINAIKFYFEKIAGRNRETFYVDRPRKEKFLPVVLNERSSAVLVI